MRRREFQAEDTASQTNSIPGKQWLQEPRVPEGHSGAEKLFLPLELRAQTSFCPKKDTLMKALRKER